MTTLLIVQFICALIGSILLTTAAVLVPFIVILLTRELLDFLDGYK